MQCRNRAKQKPSDKAEQDGEEQHVCVQTRLRETRNRARTKGAHGRKQARGKSNTADAAQQRKQNAFRYQLSDQAEWRGTQSFAQSHFSFTGGSSREKKISDVGACYQQEKSDGAKQDRESRA